LSDLLINAALPVIGLMIVCIGLLVVLRERTAITILNGAAAICVAVALVFWPDANGMMIDRWSHTIGLGAALVRLSLTLGVSLHTIAVCLGIHRWDRKRQFMLLPGIITVTACYVVFWLMARTLPQAEHLFYDGSYHGRPDIFFAMSVARGVTSSWYCLFGTYVYTLVALQTYRTLGRKVFFSSAFVLVVAFVISAGNGVAIIAEAAIDHASVQATFVVPAWLQLIYVLTFVVSMLMFAVVYLRGSIIVPLAHWLTAIIRAPQRLREIEVATGHALEVNSHIDDKLVLMISYADPDIIRMTKEACAEQDISYDDRLLVLAAATIVTLHPLNQDRRRAKGEQRLDMRELEREGVNHLAELSAMDVFFFSDGYVIAALGCGSEELGIDLRRKPQERHRRLAALLRGVLDRYDQPVRYREAYLEDLLRHAEEKKQLQGDVAMVERQRAS